jgi:hypothetical protein
MNDSTIIECWKDNQYGRRAAATAAILTGLTVDQCRRRATELGLVYTRERYRWTSAELTIVEKWAHRSLETIQRKLAKLGIVGALDRKPIKRTRAAIAHKIFQNRFRTNLDGLCQDRLAEALGVTDYQIQQWREKGMLKGERRPSIDQHRGAVHSFSCLPWFYSNRHIRRFIADYPGAFSLKRVNQAWFIDTLAARTNSAIYLKEGKRA